MYYNFIEIWFFPLFCRAESFLTQRVPTASHLVGERKSMKIELLPVSLLNTSREDSNSLSLDVNLTIYEPIILSKHRIKKALKTIEEEQIDYICFAIVLKGSKKYIVSEPCCFTSKIILLNANKCEPQEGLRGFVRSPFSSEKFFDDWFHFEKGKIF